MLFLLATPEYSNVQANTTRVKVHLRNGVAEIYDKHQDLMGKVENNLVEIETNFENKIQKFVFIVQDAVFVVSNKGLDKDSETEETGIYVYAKRAVEIGPTLSIDALSKEYDEKKEILDREIDKAVEINKEPGKVNRVLNSRILLLQEDVEFIRRSLIILRDMK